MRSFICSERRVALVRFFGVAWVVGGGVVREWQ